MDLIQIAAQIYAALIANEERKMEGSRRKASELVEMAYLAAETFMRTSEARSASKALAAIQAQAPVPEPPKPEAPAPIAKAGKRR